MYANIADSIFLTPKADFLYIMKEGDGKVVFDMKGRTWVRLCVTQYNGVKVPLNNLSLRA